MFKLTIHQNDVIGVDLMFLSNFHEHVNVSWVSLIQATIYLFKFNNENTWITCEVSYCVFSVFSIVNFEQISHIFLMLQRLTLNK